MERTECEDLSLFHCESTPHFGGFSIPCEATDIKNKKWAPQDRINSSWAVRHRADRSNTKPHIRQRLYLDTQPPGYQVSEVRSEIPSQVRRHEWNAKMDFRSSWITVWEFTGCFFRAAHNTLKLESIIRRQQRTIIQSNMSQNTTDCR